MWTSEKEAAEAPLGELGVLCVCCTEARAGCWRAPAQTAREDRRCTQQGRGQRCAPEGRMQGRINLAGVSGENIDLKCSAVF